MRRFFVKNIFFIVAINIMVKPIWVIFIDRTVQNTVRKGEYGTYQALLSLSIIFQTVLDFGISSYNSRMIAQHPDKLRTIFPAMLTGRLVLMAVYMLLACLWGYLLGYRGWELHLLRGVLVIQSLNALVSFIRSNIAALQKFKTDGLLSITDRLLMILICGSLLLYPATANHFRIQWFVAAQAFSYLVAAVIGYMVLRRVAKVQLRFSFHAPTLLKIMKQSLPYALLIFLMSVYNRVDVMMMERLCSDGKVQADIFVAAFRLLDMANILGLMFGSMLLPLFGRMLAEGQDVQPIVKLCVNMLLPMSFTVAVAGVFFSSDIMHLLYKGSSTSGAYATAFAWLIASFPAWCLMYVYSTLLTANGSLKTLNIIACCGVVLNLSLNFYLIPHYKAIGGAVTSLITQGTLALVFTIYATRTLKLPTNINWVLALAGYLGFTIALAYAITTFMQATSWLLQAGLLGAVSLVMMFVFRFVSVGSVRQLMGR